MKLFGRLRLRLFGSPGAGRRSRNGRRHRRSHVTLRHARQPLSSCLSRYSDADRALGDPVSTFGHEAIRIPAYEERARTGRSAPQRFECKGRWYRVIDTGAVWADSRKGNPSLDFGLTYFSVVTAEGLNFHLVYTPAHKRRENGSWTVHRKITYRPTSR